MAYTAQDHLNDFARMHPDVDSTTALRLLNEVDEMILAAIPMRRSYEDLALVAGTSEYDLDETLLRIWAVRLYTSATSFRTLTPTDIDTLQLDFPEWRGVGAGEVLRWYETASMTSGQIGLTPTPDQSTIRISTASNATPIVVVTTTSHGLASGDPVLISGVSGNASANGLFYISYVSGTTFTLYQDSGLTLGVAGVGSGTGGMIATSTSPKLVLECSKRTALLANTSMPTSPSIKPLYRFGMSAIYSMERRLDGAGNRWGEFQQLLGEQSDLKMKRQARKTTTIHPFRQKRSWRVSQNGRNF